MERRVCVAVVGTGPVALGLSLALHRLGVSTLLIGEPAAPSDLNTPRHFALSLSSIRCLEGLGLWQTLHTQSAAIETIQVSQPGAPGAVHLRARQAGLACFGAVIHESLLLRCLANAVAASGVPVIAGQPVSLQPGSGICKVGRSQGPTVTVTADLLVGADGGASPVRKLAGIPLRRGGPQGTALCAEITTSAPHEQRAFERLAREGPIALLPTAGDRNRWCLVWVRDTTTPQQPGLPIGELQRAFGWRAGRIEQHGPVERFAVSPARVPWPCTGKVLLIGDAAHRLHPVAGQGLNLGMRDLAVLAGMIGAADARQTITDDLPARFAHQRRADWRATTRFTALLPRLFDKRWPIAPLRGAGLLALDLLPAAKRRFARRASGLLFTASDLERGVPLP
ncbi:MAG: FAD-dependent monooxygenase [Pseudomonadota bacterium]|nr:FAD-dependent monooxygenase [Pseudomonadota bacterium]